MPTILYNYGSGPGFGTGHLRRAHWLQPAASQAGFRVELVSTPAEQIGPTLAARPHTGLYIFDRLSEPPDARPGHLTVALDNYAPWPGQVEWRLTTIVQISQILAKQEFRGVFIQCIPHPTWPANWANGDLYYCQTTYRGQPWLAMCSAHFFWGNPELGPSRLTPTPTRRPGDSQAILFYLGGLEPDRLLQVLRRVDDTDLGMAQERRFLLSKRQKQTCQEQIEHLIAHKWSHASVHWINETTAPLGPHLLHCDKFVTYYGLLCLELYPSHLDIHLLPVSQVHRHLGRWLAVQLNLGFGFRVGGQLMEPRPAAVPWTTDPEAVVGILQTLATAGH